MPFTISSLKDAQTALDRGVPEITVTAAVFEGLALPRGYQNTGPIGDAGVVYICDPRKLPAARDEANAQLLARARAAGWSGS